MNRILPHLCPSCQHALQVRSLACASCGTEVNGMFTLPALARLTEADQQFIVEFVRSSGSLKTMAEKMKLSYPTVRNLLDEVIGRLSKEAAKPKSKS